MGVGGLWPLLEPTSSSITLDRLEGKRLAVDISLWLHQAAQGYSSHNLDSKCPHLSLLIHRIAKLLFYKIRPVFVFDGAEVPVFKKQLLRNRALKKHLDELTSTKQTQMKMLERVVQEKHGDLLDDLSRSSSDPPSPKKKSRKSAEEDMFVLPSTSVKLLETSLDESKACISKSIPDYLEGFEAMVSADDRMTFLKNAKEKFREARLRIEEIPEESKDFSSFQLKRLVNRNKIHTQMEMLKKEKFAQCVRVSADKMKIVVVDNHLRSHVLLRDDDVEIINPENMERENLVKESLTWPQFLKQMEQQRKEEQQSAQQRINTDNAKTNGMDEEDDDLQQAILASISEQNALSSKDFKKLPGYGFSSADYVKQGINEDSWTSESEESGSNSNPAIASSSKAGARAAVEFMSSGSDSDESRLEGSEELPNYFPKTRNRTEANTSKEEDDGVYKDCQQFLTLLGLPYLCAPGEAEAQCSELERLGLVDGIISDDSDVWLFGAKLVYKNMFSRSKHVQEYHSGKIFKELGLERKEFVQIGILSGGDYTKGFEKVGVVTALELIAEFAKLDETKSDPMPEAFAMLEKIRDWLKSKSEFYRQNKAGENRGKNFIESSKRIRLRRIIENNNDGTVISKFPDPAVFDAYANPKVDVSSKRFKWQRVDFEKLNDFLQSKLGLSDDQIKQTTHGAFETWDKFMEQATQVYQTRITAFATSTVKHDMGLLSSSQSLEPSAKVQAALKQLKRIKSPSSKSINEATSDVKKVVPKGAAQKLAFKAGNSKSKSKPSTVPRKTVPKSSQQRKAEKCDKSESSFETSSDEST